jgi:hypothetical protein
MIVALKVKSPFRRILILQRRDTATEHDGYLGHADRCLEARHRHLLSAGIIDHPGSIDHRLDLRLTIIELNRVSPILQWWQILLLHIDIILFS